jgi:hypothetical protein
MAEVKPAEALKERPDNLESSASDEEIKAQIKDDVENAKNLSVEKIEKGDQPDEKSVLASRQTAHDPKNRAIFPDQASRETGFEPFYGHFASVEKGEHKGTVVLVQEVVGWDEQGRPLQVQVRPKRTPGYLFTVNYEDLGPVPNEA